MSSKDVISEHLEENPSVQGGKPVIRGTRIPAFIVYQMLQEKQTNAQIRKEYPQLTTADLKAVSSFYRGLRNKHRSRGS